jgi:hypothetical protein
MEIIASNLLLTGLILSIVGVYRKPRGLTTKGLILLCAGIAFFIVVVVWATLSNLM